jgi:hypothetical protein
MGRHKPTRIQYPGGALANGFFLALCPMRRYSGSDPARNEFVAVAGVCVQLHDTTRLCCCMDDLSSRRAVF